MRDMALSPHLSRLLLMGVCALIASCGKERTLVVDEVWQVGLPAQSPMPAIVLDVLEDYQNNDAFVLRLTYQVAADSTQVLREKCFAQSMAIRAVVVGREISVSGRCNEILTSEINLSSEELKALSQSEVVVHFNDRPLVFTMPRNIFGGSLPQENKHLCFEGASAKSALIWNPNPNSFVQIESRSYANEIPDSGSWRPGLDFLQILVPNVSDLATTEVKSELLPMQFTREEVTRLTNPFAFADADFQVDLKLRAIGIFSSQVVSRCP